MSAAAQCVISEGAPLRVSVGNSIKLLNYLITIITIDLLDNKIGRPCQAEKNFDPSLSIVIKVIGGLMYPSGG
jgi:hypothetical protein